MSPDTNYSNRQLIRRFQKRQQQQRNVCFEEPQAIHFKKTGENQATLQLNLELFSCLVMEGGQSQFSS